MIQAVFIFSAATQNNLGSDNPSKLHADVDGVTTYHDTKILLFKSGEFC